MQPNTILQSDILDIIFERRNKSYGAYTLRKYYNNRLIKSFGLMICLVSGLLAFFLSQKGSERNRPNIMDTITTSIIPSTPEKKKEAIKPVAEKPKQNILIKKVNTQIFVSSIKVVDNNADHSKLPHNLDSAVISNISQQGLPGNRPYVKMPSGPIPTIPGPPGDSKSIDKNTVRTTADIMPSFPGGPDALKKFLERNLVTPDVIGQGETVSVKIKFVVGFDGELKGFEVTEDGGALFNNEVIRVLKKMPKWEPGKTSGENVSVYFCIPVKFVGENE